ncbi:TetR/AcrR family transcriptional regulator [Sphingomonas sp. UYP23]
MLKMVSAKLRNAVQVVSPTADDAGTPAPRMRADARRNEEAVLEAAKIVFARSGVDAPIRKIATQAGVGLGTLYRRFSTRADLVAAVFRREVDACADAAKLLAAEHGPAEALVAWLMRYTRFLAAKQGLAAALHSGDPAFATLPEYFRSRFEPALAMLLSAAGRSGETRADIAPYDLLRAIGNLAVTSGDDGEAHTERMVMLLMDGLRYGVEARVLTKTRS